MEAEVSNEIAVALKTAWNQHDMKAFAGLFHVDAAFVNIGGRYLRGRDEIEEQHAFIHAGAYKDSTIGIVAEDSREVVTGLIVAHLSTEVNGHEGATGEPRRAVMTLVIELRNCDWKITAAHNTLIAAASG